MERQEKPPTTDERRRGPNGEECGRTEENRLGGAKQEVQDAG